jgi:hypothetical protein
LGAGEFGLFSVLCLALSHYSGLLIAEKTALQATEAELEFLNNLRGLGTEYE